MEWLNDILAAIGVVLNGLPQGILAMTYGFASVPTALGFALGIGGTAVFQSVAPISFQAETVTLAGSMGKNMRERLSMILFAGLAMAGLGATGLLTKIITFAGESIIHGMMAGVGIMLAKVAVDMVKANKLVGGISMGTGILIYLLCTTLGTGNELVYTIVGCVVISSVVGYLMGQRPEDVKEEKPFRMKLVKPTFNLSVLRGALALACLTIGANIAFGGITGSIAGAEANIDHLTIYSGLADSASALFGGAPVEAIISATAAAPHAIISGIIMMAIMFVILITGVLPKIGKFVSSQSIAGFLFVLGAFVTAPGDGAAALSGPNPLQGGVTMVVTAIVDPFVGMLAGIALKFVEMLAGVL